MTVHDPVIELAVRLIAMNETLDAYLCCRVPTSCADIRRVSLGHGEVGGGGGLIEIDRSGTARCLAYDVRGQLLISYPQGCPSNVTPGNIVKIGRTVFKDGAVRRG